MLMRHKRTACTKDFVWLVSRRDVIALSRLILGDVTSYSYVALNTGGRKGIYMVDISLTSVSHTHLKHFVERGTRAAGTVHLVRASSVEAVPHHALVFHHRARWRGVAPFHPAAHALVQPVEAELHVLRQNARVREQRVAYLPSFAAHRLNRLLRHGFRPGAKQVADLFESRRLARC